MTVERWLSETSTVQLGKSRYPRKNKRSPVTRGGLKKDEHLTQINHVDVHLTFDPVVVVHEKELLVRILLGSTDPTIDPEVM